MYVNNYLNFFKVDIKQAGKTTFSGLGPGIENFLTVEFTSCYEAASRINHSGVAVGGDTEQGEAGLDRTKPALQQVIIRHMGCQEMAGI